MRYRRLALSTLSIAALLLAACAEPPSRNSAPVTAATTENEPSLSEDELRPYVEFVRKHTGYELDPLPRVVVSQTRLQSVARDFAAVHGPVNAFYTTDGSRRTIYLNSARFALDNNLTSGDLIHELTHHGQWLALEAGGTALAREKGWKCARAQEREAFEVQNKWIFERTGRVAFSQAVVDRASECEAAFTFEARSEPQELQPGQLHEYVEWLEGKISYPVHPLPQVIVDRQQFSREAKIDIDSSMDIVMVARRGRPSVFLDSERFALGNRIAEGHLIRGLFLNAVNNALEREGRRLVESKGWACPRAALREAFDIQNAWLREKAGGNYISEDTIAKNVQCAPGMGW